MHRLAVGLLFVWVAAAGLFMAWHDSLTTDEDIHMASGYTILTRADFRFDPEHTPLFKELTALPLLALHLSPPSDDQALWNAAAPTFYDSWQEARSWSDRWTFASGNPADLMKFLARLPSVVSLLLLCWLLYYLTNEWFGRQAALLTLFFTAFNPTLLAHGHLANDDVAVVTAILFGLALFWRYLKSPSIGNALLVGLGLTVAIGTKFTGFGLLPVFFLYMLFFAWQERKGLRTLGHGLLMLLSVWLGIWTLYGFHSSLNLTDASLHLAGESWHIPYGLTLPQIIRGAQEVRLFLPLAFLKGLIIVENGTKYGRGGYLFGHTFYPSLWYYFPAIIALKTQIVTFAVLLVGLLLSLGSKAGALGKRPYQLLALSLLIFGGLIMHSKLDLGVRYTTPVLALAMPFVALSLLRIGRLNWRSWIIGGTLVLYALPALAQFPDLLSFSSEIVQPYAEGWRYMNDSNIDWGQEASQVAVYSAENLHTNGIAANYGWNPYQLGYYGLKTESFDPLIPPTGRPILITANQLATPEYARFRQLKPIGSIANVAFFYRISQ